MALIRHNRKYCIGEPSQFIITNPAKIHKRLIVTDIAIERKSGFTFYYKRMFGFAHLFAKDG